MAAYDEYTPVIPLPNPGEGGPVYPGDDMDTDPGGTPVIPLPNPGEGGPVYPGPDYPDYPDFPVYPSPPNRPAGRGRVRFLHAAYGYRPFRIAVSNRRLVNGLRYGGISGYSQVAAGYQTVTVSGTHGYIYLQKTVPGGVFEYHCRDQHRRRHGPAANHGQLLSAPQRNGGIPGEQPGPEQRPYGCAFRGRTGGLCGCALQGDHGL